MAKKYLVLRVFLGAYMLLLLHHLEGEIHELTLVSAFLFVAGAAIALFAHSRSGLLLYILLCLHMCIEWIGYGMRGWAFSWGDGGAFEVIHLCFDVSFLMLIARWTWPRWYIGAVLGTLTGLAILSGMGWLIAVNTPIMLTGYPIHSMEFLILGGIFGCTGFHIIWPLRMKAHV